MEGRGDREPPGAYAGGTGGLDQAVDLGGGAADHDLVGRVAVADPKVRTGREEFGDALLGGEHRGHRAGVLGRVPGGGRHGPTAGAGELVEGVLVVRPRRVQGGQFAEAVAEEALGLEAQFREVPEVSGGERADRGLGVGGGAQRGLLLGPALVVDERRRERHPGQRGVLTEVPVGAVEGGAQRGQREDGAQPGVDVLAALTGEERGHPARLAGGAPVVDAPGVGPCVPVRSGAQLTEGEFAQRVGLGLVAGREGHPGVPRGDRAAGGRGLRREGVHEGIGTCRVPQVDAGDREADLQVVAVAVLLEHGVEVGAAEAERGERRPALRALRVADPRPGPGVDVEGAVRAEGRVGPVHIDGGRQHLVVQGEGELDHRGRAGRRLGVTDLGLHAADGGVAPLAAVLGDHLGERAQLGRVADRRAGAVRLEQLDAVGGRVGVLVGAAQRLHLALLAGA